jgi:hypothetical protein
MHSPLPERSKASTASRAQPLVTPVPDTAASTHPMALTLWHSPYGFDSASEGAQTGSPLATKSSPQSRIALGRRIQGGVPWR